MRRIHLQYGTQGLDLEVDARNVTVVEPRFVPGLPDEGAGFVQAVRSPIGTRPLRELISSQDRVAVVIPDITRPLPSERLLPWLFGELSHVAPDRFTIINGTAVCQVAGQEFTLSNNATACIPRGKPHRFINRSDRPMAMIWVYAGDEPERTLVDPGFCEGTLDLSRLPSRA